MGVIKHRTDDLRALRLRWIDGEPLEGLAEEIGVHRSRLYALWTERGLTAELPRRRVLRIPRRQLEAIHGRWCAGESIVDLAAELGLPRSTLWAALNRAGMPLSRPDGVPALGGDFDEERRRQRRQWYRWASGQSRDGHPWREIHAELARRGYPASKRTLISAVREWERKVFAARKGKGVDV